jgi:hypothetical protein
MKRRLLLSIVAVIIVMASAIAVRNHGRSVAQKKREVAYQSALQNYSRDLRPGLRRTEVEGYLRARNVNFSWIYTGFGGRRESQYADILKIGEEAAPWYCSEAYVYVAFEFSGVEKFKQDDSDLLERIEIFRPYTGCL